MKHINGFGVIYLVFGWTIVLFFNRFDELIRVRMGCLRLSYNEIHCIRVFLLRLPASWSPTSKVPVFVST